MRRALLLIAAILVVLAVAACSQPASSIHATPATVSSPRTQRAGDTDTYAVRLHWDISWPGHTATGYDITQDGTQIADVTSSPYIVGGLSCGTSYTFGVKAHDGSGNTSSEVTTDYTPACPSSDTFPLQVSSNGRYLEDASGSPFLMVGDSPQSGIGNLSETNADSYLADRAAHGFNTVWENLLCGDYTYCNADGTTYDGIKPFTTGTSINAEDFDLTTPNLDYFDRAHDMVAQAEADGIEVILDPIETGNCNGWYYTLKNNGNGTVSTSDKDYQYGQYLGNEFKDLPNVIWMLGNDFSCYDSDSEGDADLLSVADGIRNTDPTALQTSEIGVGGYVNEGWASLDDTTDDWASALDINGFYSYAPTYAIGRHAYSQSSTHPTIQLESNYEGEVDGGTDGCTTVRNCRLSEWWAMTSGASGQMYGCECTTHLTNSNYSSTTIDTTGVTQLGYQTSLLDSIDWWKLEPDTSNSIVTSGSGTCPTTGSITDVDCVTTAAASDGSLALSYLPKGGTITVDLSQFAGDVTARWYDPTDGDYTSISGSPFTNSGTHSFTAPSSNSAGDDDWALVLQSSSSPAEMTNCLQMQDASGFNAFEDPLGSGHYPNYADLDACDYPSPDTAGVPSGTTLTTLSGTCGCLPSGDSFNDSTGQLWIGGTGTVSDVKCPSSGCWVTLGASGGTITDSEIRCSTCNGGVAIVNGQSNSYSVTITHSTIGGTGGGSDCSTDTVASSDIGAARGSVLDHDVLDCSVEDVNGDGYTLTNSYVIVDGYGDGTHNEAFYMPGNASGNDVEDNTLLDPLSSSAVIFMDGKNGALGANTISDNLIAGAGYGDGAIAGGGDSVEITDNRFSDTYDGTNDVGGVCTGTPQSGNYSDSDLSAITIPAAGGAC